MQGYVYHFTDFIESVVSFLLHLICCLLACYEPVTAYNVVVVECIYEPYVFSHSVVTSSAECNHCSPSSSLVCGQLLTICDVIWHLQQGHMSVAARPHVFDRMHSGLDWSGSDLEVPVASR